MVRQTHHVGFWSVVFAAILLLSGGCVSTPEWYRKYQQPYRAHPELDRRAKAVRVVGLLPPDIKIYELTAGGVTELRDEWSAAGRDAVVQGLSETLKERGVGLVLGAVTGQPVVSQGTTVLNIALVDRSGAVLWYKIAGDSGGFDLRDARSAKAFVQRLVADFPAVGR